MPKWHILGRSILNPYTHIHQSFIQQIFIALQLQTRYHSQWEVSIGLLSGAGPDLPFASVILCKSVTPLNLCFWISSLGSLYQFHMVVMRFKWENVWLGQRQKRLSINTRAGHPSFYTQHCLLTCLFSLLSSHAFSTSQGLLPSSADSGANFIPAVPKC